MRIECKPFDNLHSMIGLGKTRTGRSIVLSGRSNDREMKIMFVRSESGTPIDLERIEEDLLKSVFSADGQLITDEWIVLNADLNTKVCFVSLQNTKCEVKGDLCRYTAFSYIFRNNQIEIYDCDNNQISHKAFVDITMPIFYSIEKAQLERRVGWFRNRTELIDSGYYKVTIDCDDIDLYEVGYVNYMCGDIPIPVTKEMIKKGFFVKAGKNDPELKTTRRELIDLRRRG